MKVISSRLPMFFALIVSVVTLLSVAKAQADYTILHNFGGSGDGSNPHGGPISSGSILYGTTTYGGSNGGGIVFKMNTDGTDYAILHNFGTGGDGYNPLGGPILSSSTIYGVTYWGGSYGGGVLFKMSTDGTGYTVLHNFGASEDGRNPWGSPILSGSTFYGMTSFGGNYGWGTLYKMNTDGTGYSILHNFGDTGDGAWPHGAPILSGSTLYGVTAGGGNTGWPCGWWCHWWWGAGTLFKINTDGTGYTILHNFDPNSGDGAWPANSPILSGSTLYGTTVGGGSYRGSILGGTLYKMDIDGTGYTILHNFGDSGDGVYPFSKPILSGSTLYGMTALGGSNSEGYWGPGAPGGTLYKMNTDSTGYTILHNFNDFSGDGYYTESDPILSGSTIYGTVWYGGNNGGGVLFSYTLSSMITVTIDIKPGSYPNSINLSSKGVVPVAVLTTDNFDASGIDSGTVSFAGAKAVNSSLEDVNGDGRLDMVFHFDTQELNLDSTSTSATLTGKTVDGKDISGEDSVNIVPKKK